MLAITPAPAGKTLDGAELIARAKAIVPVLRERSARANAERRVPDETIADFQRAGFFRAIQPRKFGGLGLPFGVFAQIVRILAHGCASSAWVYAVIGELGWVMALFPEDGQREVWGNDASAIGAAAVDPSGKAERAEGGYRLSGTWRFVSGSDHAQWFYLTSPCAEPDSKVINRQFLLRRADIEFIDDWYVMGLVATGSKSVKASNVFVPDRRSITQDQMIWGTAPGAAVNADYVVIRTPRRFLTSYSITPVIVGLAERALEITIEGIKKRLGAGTPPPEFEAVRLRVADAAADIETARLILDSRLQDADARLANGEAITEADVLKQRFISGHMVKLARQGIDRIAQISGSGWVFDGSALQLIFRDAMTGSTHRGMSYEIHAMNYLR